MLFHYLNGMRRAVNPKLKEWAEKDAADPAASPGDGPGYVGWKDHSKALDADDRACSKFGSYDGERGSRPGRRWRLT